ncbi:STAS domain-containing protein [Marinobacterium marinum]|uniref:STAS domain-containing protein n=1 Tax=Marinobacterium marinum TaxID=2756129 RepID=A0A7W2AD13_9GAMM|nr:STAS domain-containing protein [Marinobacterium marinum]MBA4503112.1 STAS domain-containing protein [Marinobacterium marinum]
MAVAKVETASKERVRISGDLTFATVLSIRAPLLKQLQACGPRCLLDLSGVERVDSSALSLWLVCQRQAQRLGQELVLEGVPADFDAIAGLVGLAAELPRGS